MKTVAAPPPQLPLATSAQAVESASGSTRLVLRAKMPGTWVEAPAAQVQEPAEPRGRMLDQEA